jgi:hypothetical protein
MSTRAPKRRLSVVFDAVEAEGAVAEVATEGDGGAGTTPPAPKRRRLSRMLSADAQRIIIHAYARAKQERGSAADRVSALLGVGRSTVVRVERMHRARLTAAAAAGVPEEQVEVPDPPVETRKRVSPVKEHHKAYLQWVITRCCDATTTELPTIRSIFAKTQELKAGYAAAHHANQQEVYPFKITRTYELLQEMGFKYGGNIDSREALKRQTHVIEMRRHYLCYVAALRAQGYTIFYQDETWVNKNTTRRKHWFNEASGQVVRPGGKRAPIGLGGRAIVVGIGSGRTGIVGELLDVFRGKKAGKEQDYHKEMNATVFEQWWQRVLDWLVTHKDDFDGKVAVVIDNAKYHSRITEDSKTPTAASQKRDIAEYLQREGIVPIELAAPLAKPGGAGNVVAAPSVVPPVDAYMGLKKPALLNAVVKKETKYVVDEMAKAVGIRIARLPPYHCELNPIEMVWAKAKGEVARRNVEYKLSAAMQIMDEETKKCGSEYWQKLVEHVKKEEERVLEADTGLQIAIEAAIERSHEWEYEIEAAGDDGSGLEDAAEEI